MYPAGILIILDYSIKGQSTKLLLIPIQANSQHSASVDLPGVNLESWEIRVLREYGAHLQKREEAEKGLWGILFSLWKACSWSQWDLAVSVSKHPPKCLHKTPWVQIKNLCYSWVETPLFSVPHGHREQYKHEIIYNHRLGHDMSLCRLQETFSEESVGEKIEYKQNKQHRAPCVAA